jgi:secreted trypsin-like serine protease
VKRTPVWSKRVAAVVTSVLAVGVLTATPALSISGGQTTGGQFYLATVDTGIRSCTGEQIAPQWIITAASCAPDVERP